MKRITLKELPNSKLEGYIWLSDELKPRIISSVEDLLIDEQQHFIAEGFLYDDKHKKSYSIKNVDTELYLVEYEIAEKGEALSYLASNRFPKNIKRLNFEKHRISIDNNNCAGLITEKDLFIAFKGFSYE